MEWKKFSGVNEGYKLNKPYQLVSHWPGRAIAELDSQRDCWIAWDDKEIS